MNYKSPMNNQNKGYGGESASQERSNLLSVNPLTKHMSTPMHMGGSKSYGSAMMMKKSPCKKTDKKIIQDYSRNAIADYKAGDKKAANYEKKKALEVGAGEGK